MIYQEIEYTGIARIIKPHGLNGRMKLMVFPDYLLEFESQDKFLLIRVNGMKEIVTITEVSGDGNHFIIKLQGVNTKEEALALKGASINVAANRLKPLKKDEYYIKDLMGMEVISDEDEKLGNLVDVLVTGANDVYVVKDKSGKDLLIPAIKDCILDIDLENRLIKVHLLEGLR